MQLAAQTRMAHMQRVLHCLVAQNCSSPWEPVSSACAATA